ncbi:MAG: YgdI/YgdR family lipoprotein [Magnetococcales bacterium]|nr:YgdI/YgdR family lipoprotein [Magnetococcales bacterium]
MKKIMACGLAFGVALFLVACSSKRYIVVTNEGTIYHSEGKVERDDEGWVSFKTPVGKEIRLRESVIRSINEN